MKFHIFNIISSRKKIGDTGDVWSLPNYDGDLYTADTLATPFLSMIGGLNGGLSSSNFEFPTASLYSHDAAAQPAITEAQSIAGVTASQKARTQEKNVTQIFQEAISVSYVKQSNLGRLSGINTAGAISNVTDELAWQQLVKLQKIARDVNYTFLNGAYQISTANNVANKTRGMFALCGANTTIDASTAALSKTLLDQLFRDMWAAGARFANCVIFVNAFQKQSISKLYGYAPTDRNVGGVNIKQIATDFGDLGITLDAMVPAASLGVFEMSVLAPVFQPVPGKGNLFYEPLAKTGAAESGQIFGQIGLDHGPGFLHGSITNLATS